MEIQHYHQDRILVQYVFMKLKGKIDYLKIEDLTEYFNEKGWFMYDLEKMNQDIQTWRKKKGKATKPVMADNEKVF